MMKFISDWIRNVFGFSKTETKGLPILVLVVVVFFFAPLLFKWYSASTYSAAADDQIILDSLIHQLSTSTESTVKVYSHEFDFNPNTIGLDSLLLLGFRKEVAQRIINYRKAGGQFEVKGDLKKIYGINSERYDHLYGSILLPETIPDGRFERDKLFAEEKEALEVNNTEEKTVSVFDINKADTSQLKRIYGIGPVLSGRIIKYRELLGGFVKKEQLKEVYGIKEDVYNSLAAQVFIRENYIPERINVNQDSIKQLTSHPYVSYNLAKSIYNYRLQHGAFQSKPDLLKIHLFDSVLLEKIIPYIDF